MSDPEWQFVCKWCGKKIVLRQDFIESKPKWDHVTNAYWCHDSTGTRRAPSPDYEASEKINAHKRGDMYSKDSLIICPKCMGSNLEATYYVFYGGPELIGYRCYGCDNSLDKDMKPMPEITLTGAERDKYGGDWNN